MRRIAIALAVPLSLVCLPHAIPGYSQKSQLPLHLAREADSDLEVGGDLVGLPSGSTRFISYKDLLALPQTAYTVSDDANFAGRTKISGIPLEQLAQALGAPGSKLVAAICYDGYLANYPTSYIAAHHPVLVLKINGKTEENWPKSEHGGPLRPYMISHPSFTPSFKVLSHNDEAQIPFGVTRIEIRDEQAVLGSIAPHGNFAPNSPVMN